MDFHLPGAILHSFLPANFFSGKILPLFSSDYCTAGKGKELMNLKGKETSSLLLRSHRKLHSGHSDA